ncbi:hypothetical protein [Wenjunlia tyrosinilytica]|uniref:Uncharacterized protein n=1 Tax=Wenjunlia tyrosinilytica TaxID=1544741 RepID=A0A917ZKQ3_9ACTN|nr:hypothetical protein [Wenjunlia tyrosinilytica]GGO83612.1 hypothetical protein GCM10012280_13030 [Wenjunlia tyrosinilytica]
MSDGWGAGSGPGRGPGPGPGSGPGDGRQDGGQDGRQGGQPHSPWPPAGQPGVPAPRNPGEPDWDALAAATARGTRRRRLFMIGGGALAAAAVAGIVAVAISRSGSHSSHDPAADLPSASALPPDPGPSAPDFPAVSRPPAPDPLAFISSAGKDTAPLTPGTLFPDKRMSIDDRSYTRATTSTTKNCASVTQGGLGSVLARNGCHQVLRATYVRDGKAVTVGVAVFDDAKAASRARKQATGNIAAMSGGGVGTFCRPVACWRTSNAVGRYAYFTIAGPADGGAASGGDRAAKQAGRDAGTFAFDRIVQRGRDAAAR